MNWFGFFVWLGWEHCAARITSPQHVLRRAASGDQDVDSPDAVRVAIPIPFSSASRSGLR